MEAILSLLCGAIIGSALCTAFYLGFRTIEQGGLTMNDEKVTNPKQIITKADFEKNGYIILKKGKKTILKVEI